MYKSFTNQKVRMTLKEFVLSLEQLSYPSLLNFHTKIKNGYVKCQNQDEQKNNRKFRRKRNQEEVT